MRQNDSYVMEDFTSRPLVLFTNAIKSTHTRKQYLYNLRKFLLWCNINNVEDLIKRSEAELQVLLEDYLFYLKQRISPNSLNPKFAALELFFSINDKTLNFKKIRKMFPAKVKKSGKDYWTTEQITEMLKIANNRRTRALIHFLASTACRIGAIPELKLRHAKDYKENCKEVTLYEDTNEEYTGFLTPEASQELDSYLKQRRMDGEFLTENSPLFRETYRIGSAKARHVSEGALQLVIKRVVRHLDREKTGNRYNIQTDHGFRKRFNTILKNNKEGNIALKEKLMGHKGVYALDGSYHNPDVQILFNEFKIHIANLTISGEERLRQENMLKQEEIDTLAKKNPKVEELAQRVEVLEYGSKARQTELVQLVHAIDQRAKTKEYDKTLAHLGKTLHEGNSQDEDKPTILEALMRIWFELRAPEKQKQEIWKKIKNLKEGETMSISAFGPSNGLSVKNFYDDGSDD